MVGIDCNNEECLNPHCTCDPVIVQKKTHAIVALVHQSKYVVFYNF